MEVNFTDIELSALQNSGSNIGNFLNSLNNRDLRRKVFAYTSFLPINAFVIQRVYHVINHLRDTVKCEECCIGTPKWSHDDKGYRKFCCSRCSRKQPTLTFKETCIEKYRSEERRVGKEC